MVSSCAFILNRESNAAADLRRPAKRDQCIAGESSVKRQRTGIWWGYRCTWVARRRTWHLCQQC